MVSPRKITSDQRELCKSGFLAITPLYKDNDRLDNDRLDLISESRTLEMCTANSISSRGVIYIMSNNYAYDHSVTATNCNCSVSVSNNASYSTHAPSTNITMVTVHTELGTGQQLSLMSLQGVFLRNFTLQTSQYAVSSEQLPYSELDLIWRSRKTGSTGRFWVGFQSKFIRRSDMTMNTHTSNMLAIVCIQISQPFPVMWKLCHGD